MNNALYSALTSSGTCSTVIVNDLIDFSKYSTVTLVSSVGTITLDVSGYSGSGYLAFDVLYINNARYLNLLVTSVCGNNYSENVVSSLRTDLGYTASSISISSVIIE